MQRRGIDVSVVEQVLAAPEQTVQGRSGKVVLQSRIQFGSPGRLYLVRAFVDVDRDPAEVVTVYRTSKFKKYWRASS